MVKFAVSEPQALSKQETKSTKPYCLFSPPSAPRSFAVLYSFANHRLFSCKVK